MFAWQATVQNEAGNVIPNPLITVRVKGTNALASIYATDGGAALPNPFTGDLEGFVKFFANPGVYLVTGASGSDATAVWEVELGVPVATQAQAVAGTSDAVFMTPLKVAQVLDTAVSAGSYASIAALQAASPNARIISVIIDGDIYKRDPAGTIVSANGARWTRQGPRRTVNFGLAYSQSNFANVDAPGTPWRVPPPDNLYVWNSGNWNGNVNPPVGTSFVRANTLAPRLVSAYWADIARKSPDEDFCIVIIARGGTGITALTGIQYRWDSATGTAPPNGHINLNAGNNLLRFSENDVFLDLRFTGTTSLGTDAFYPGRLQNNADPNSYITFTSTSAFTQQTGYRTQAITITGQNNWPPAEGAVVKLFTQQPRMDTIMRENVEAAMTNLGLTGQNRRIDKLFLWPTESDLNYRQAYINTDLPYLMSFLSQYRYGDTQELYTLPYPYGSGISQVREQWWNVIRSWVQRDPAGRKIVSLDNTPVEAWGDNNNIHVLTGYREMMGSMIARSEERGGVLPFATDCGVYTPTITSVANVASTTAYPVNWSRVGRSIRVSGMVQVTPTAADANTEVRISLPVAGSINLLTGLTGQAVSEVTRTPGIIVADTTNNAAILRFSQPNLLTNNWRFDFTYDYIPLA